MTAPMKLILGTMMFGPQVNTDDSLTMVQRFLDAGHHEMDTAYVYNEGETEKILGTVLKEIPENSCYLATKAHPRITGRLDGPAVTMQLEESLRRLGRESVDLLYLHMPDSLTPIEETLQACAVLHEKGWFRDLGLSNFPAWMVVDIWHLCKQNGWPLPVVYQGRYNGLSRNVEKELLPALQKLGIRFYAFNPLAGGMLSGKHTNFNGTPAPGRFSLRESYRNRYWKTSYFDAVSGLAKTCRDEGVEPAEAAFRWLVHHSFLDIHTGDGIIIGASSIKQFEQNLSAVKKGKLSDTVVNAFNTAWHIVKNDSPNYFRFYNQ